MPPQVPVAVFLTSFHPGGTQRQMVELARHLDRAIFTKVESGAGLPSRSALVAS